MNYYTEELTQVTPVLEEFIFKSANYLVGKIIAVSKNYVGSGAWKKVCGMLHIQKIKL